MIMSPSMSLVAAGVASGICFILFSSMRKGKAAESDSKTQQKIIDDSRCACCLKPLFVGRGVRCNDCGARSCRKGCSRWDTSDNAWHCLFCHQRRSWLRKNEKWFETFGGVVDEEELHRYFSTAKSRVYVEGVENAAASSGFPLGSDGREEAHAMETIRDFVEKIVEGLIGNVDETPIDRLYHHPAYDKLLAKYIVPLAGALARLAVALQMSLSNKPTEDPPTMAHAALRDIVERAVEDARKLPGLGTSGSKEGTQEGRNIAEHSYEDLLATAILNKVIEKFQREQVDGNSNVLLDKPAQITKCTLSENEIGLDERVEEGCSSLEPLSHNDCSSECNASCLRHVRNQPERLSLTIEERIEEVTTTYTSDEEHREHDVLAIKNTHRVPFPELGMDIIDPSQDSSEDSLDEVDTPTAHVDLISPIESWEENWLFQKKRVQVQADSVAMLVPNSSADYKALIGDKDAEDTSDLSECSSAMSDEEIEKELREAISNVVPRSPKKTEFDVENALDIATETSDGSRAKDEVASDFRTELPASYTKGLPINALEKQNMDEKKAEGTGKTELKTSNETSAKLENGIRTSSSSENRRAGMENGSESNVNESNTSSSKGSSCVVAENKAKEIEVKSVQRESKSVKIESPDVPIANASNNVPEFTEPKGTLSVENYVGIDDVEPEKTDKEFETIFKEVVGENGVNLIDLKKEPIDAPIKEDSCLQKSATTAENSIGPSSIPLLDENVACDAPKTPACTPTRTSLTEDNVENVDDAENFIADNATVLNSLECAKKKLMVVDDNSVESLRDEETKPMMQKVDFNEDAQQESEYTEHYDTATQRHLDSLTKIETSSKENELIMETFDQETTLGNSILIKEETKCREAVAFAKAESASYMSLQNVKSAEEVQLTAPPRPGTIAEREHKKWENAPPIENNPYSEESIQKRLWQRQYSRRLSDIPGIHSELPKSNGTDLEVILTPQEPDIKRFSRDYYINNAKAASGDKGRRSTTSISSRPSSSLSQRSNSTGADQEQQEETQYKETESLLGRSHDVKSKVAKWQRNNAETNYQASMRHSVGANETIQAYSAEKIDERFMRKNDVIACQKGWDEQRVEDMLENERKNSKNEINARLNNQENNYGNGSMLEAKSENEKKIRRIDLKAYGFENEFCLSSNKAIKTSSQRVVNKLDLKSFGYDGGLRRTQSNNHLDSTVSDRDLKPRIVKVTNKSNLTRHSDYCKADDRRDFIGSQGSGDNILTQSTEALNKLRCESYGAFGSLKSAKSVPNVAKCEFYADSEEQEDREIESYSVRGAIEDDVNKLGTTKNYESAKSNVKNGDVTTDESENDTENSFERDRLYRSTEKLPIHSEKEEILESRTYVTKPVSNKLPLPSVRRLAEAFNKQPESVPIPGPRTTKSSVVCKERSSTPEIHIVETPRQMHSLTARSLSKKFREGLRQIPNKVTSPPASHVTMEQTRVPESQAEVVQSKGDNALNDTKVISPGKLKSNIIFWEEMQKRN